MALSAGQRLGAYEVLAPLGAGGMGEVYEARDTRLERRVALKVLPAELSSDPEALARFEREAKAIAALSHPNILAIHDFGRDGGIAYVVVELLEGETLRDRLRSGALPVRKAAEIGLATALGLAAAHEKGFVHRDLKPDNVFVTWDGHVKVLDFGLAKRIEATPDGTPTGPVLTSLTRPGTAFGTPGYMAPEQITNQSVDHRADIFAFGCVLHEMLTAQRAFPGSSAFEAMSAAVRDEPPAIVDPAVPGALRRILDRCLEKAPEARFQSARDLAFSLSDFTDATPSARSWATQERPGPRTALLPLAAAGAALLGLLGGFLLGRNIPETAPRPVAFRQLTDRPGLETRPSLAPDGKSFVHVSGEEGSRDVVLQRVGGRNPNVLTHDCPLDDQGPAFSPDGERIAFRSECNGGGVFVMGATGEAMKRVADWGHDPSWSPDGRELALAEEAVDNPASRQSRASKLWAVPLDGGPRRLLHGGDAVQPAWSPHGRRVAFWSVVEGQRDIWTVAADGTGARAVTSDAFMDWAPSWSPDGAFLYFASDRGGCMNLWRVPIDEGSGAPRGEPEPVTTPARWTTGVSFAADGRSAAFAIEDERSTLMRSAFDPAAGRLLGEPRPVLGSSRVLGRLDVAPDGSFLTYYSAAPEDVYVVRADGSGLRQLTDDAHRDRVPRISPDGKRIAFYSNRGGRYDVWAVGVDGAGLARLTQGSDFVWNPAWAPDGRRIAAGAEAGTALHDIAGGPPALLPRLAVDRVFLVWSWSPDGARLAGMEQAPDGTTSGVVVHELASGSSQRWASECGFPVFLPDSRRLLCTDGHSIRILDREGAGRALLSPHGFDGIFSLSRDGRTLAWIESPREADVWLLQLS